MIFLFLFLLSCIIFWWMPYFINIHVGIGREISQYTFLVSLFNFLFFSIGYITLYFSLKNIRFRPLFFRDYSLRKLSEFTENLLVLITPICLIFAIIFFFMRLGYKYGEGPYMPFIFQVFFYLQIFLYFVYATTIDITNYKQKKFILLTIFFVLTRLIVSLQWGRLFLAYSIVPLFILLLARGIIRLTFKNIVVALGLFLVLLFAIPFFRGDFSKIQGNSIFVEIAYSLAFGGPISLFDEYKYFSYEEIAKAVGIDPGCNPLLISLTAWLIPYKYLGICTMDIWQAEGRPATLDRIFAMLELGPKTAYETLYGPSSVYFIELYFAFGENLFIVYLMSALLGGLSAFAYTRLRYKTLFGVAYLEILLKVLFAPRSNFGQIFEKAIPFAFGVIIILLLISLINFLRRLVIVQRNPQSAYSNQF